MIYSKTESSEKHEQITLDLGLPKRVELSFDGGSVCTDGGLLILRKADMELELSELVACALKEKRRLDLVKHKPVDMIRQRVYAIAAGYEDCNDAGKLRSDAMHKLAVGYEPASEHLLASQPTLSRFENKVDAEVNAALQRLLPRVFIRTMKKPPQVLRISMDTTCDEVYGYQQLSFYNSFYEAYCYAPLFIWTDCGFPLAALLRPGNPNVVEDAIRMLKQVIAELKRAWPKTRLELTADAGFASPEMYEFCEKNGITYFIAAPVHSAFRFHTEEAVRLCKKKFDEFGYPSPELKRYAEVADPKEAKRLWRQREERIRYSSKEEGRMQEHFEDDLFVRRYGEFEYQSREWSCKRRILYRVHYTRKGPDVRCVVTNHKSGKARKLYDERYCQRSQCENWIKDVKTYLKCDRTSCQEFEANQFRLFLHTFAYILIWQTRKTAKLKGMTAHTFMIQFLKIGVIVKQSARKVALHLASNFPWKEQYLSVWNTS